MENYLLPREIAHAFTSERAGARYYTKGMTMSVTLTWGPEEKAVEATVHRFFCDEQFHQQLLDDPTATIQALAIPERVKRALLGMLVSLSNSWWWGR